MCVNLVLRTNVYSNMCISRCTLCSVYQYLYIFYSCVWHYVLSLDYVKYLLDAAIGGCSGVTNSTSEKVQSIVNTPEDASFSSSSLFNQSSGRLIDDNGSVQQVGFIPFCSVLLSMDIVL